MMKKLLKPCLAVSLMSLAASAQEAAKPAAPAQGAVVPAAPAKLAPDAAAPDAAIPAKPAQDADQLLAFLPEIVATYGDKKITAADIKKEIKPGLQQAIQLGSRPIAEKELKEGITSMVNQMIDKDIAINMVEKDGIKADFETAKKKIEEQLKGDPTTEEMMKAQGTSKEKEIENMAREAQFETWVKEKVTKEAVKPTDEEIKKVYDENKDKLTRPQETRTISHILIGAKKDEPADKKAAAKKKCEELLAKVKAGGDFAALAKENSDCPSKMKGGSLGENPKGAMVPEFDAVAFKLEKGQISDVVETPFGYHIIRLDAINAAGTVVSLDEVKENISDWLANKKIGETIRKKLDDTKKTLNVKINI